MPMPLSKQEKIKEFWKKRKEEIEDIEDFGERVLPMARIKKVICAEKGTMMMSWDTPSFVTKACETFVQELAFRAWMCAESHQRHVILDSDIAEAISSTESYDFLKDILHAYQKAQHSTIPHTKSTRKHHQLHQPSTSHPPLSRQAPKFYHYSTGYPFYIHTPIPVPPKKIHPNPLAFPFLSQDGCSWMAKTITSTNNITESILPNSCLRWDSRFFGNNLLNTTARNLVPCNDIVSSNAMTLPRQVYQGPMPDIPNTFSIMNMTNTSTAYGAEDANIDNIPTQNGGVSVESNYILSRVVESGSLIPTCGAINSLDETILNTTICVEEGLHQQQEQKTTSDHHVDGNLEGIIATGTSESGGIQNQNFDEFEMVDESWMSEFWSEFMMEDPTPFLDPTSTNSLQKLEQIDHEPYLSDDIVANASSSNKQSETNSFP
ncbi:hypothetical protein QOZ80_6BG0468520 [Eleusine coracana subsp. coracana]|nr:hypothetical protein QOZ80_6BG0468520 [Eleusine coracana subsp. coracana]